MASKANSWLPLVALAASMIAVVLMISPDAAHGRNGPPVFPGLLQPPGFEEFVPAGTLVPKLTIREESISDRFAPVYPPSEWTDERAAWDRVAIILDDDEPITRTLGRSLAEHLLGIVAEGGEPSPIGTSGAARVVFLQPREEANLSPLALRRVVRLATLDGAVPEKLGDAATFAVGISVHDVITPTVRDVSGLGPTDGVTARYHIIDIDVPADASIADWPTWHISVGRRVAATILDAWDAGSAPAPESAQRSRWLRLAGQPTATAGDLDWQGPIPPTPGGEVERWFASFQTPLIRGHSGVITGLTVPVKMTHEPTILRLHKRLSKGEWQLRTDPPSDWSTHRETLQWSCEREGAFERLVADPTPFGWRIAVWERHPDLLSIVAKWIADAQAGDEDARQQLTRHRNAALLTEEQRQIIADILSDE